MGHSLPEGAESGKIVEIRIEDSYRDGAFAELAFAYAPVGLVVTENRVIRDCNRAFAEMFQYTCDDLRNQIFSILYPSDEEFVNIRDRGIEQLRETNRYWDERIMARKDGSLFWCRVRGHSFTPDDPLMRAVWSFADLSATRPYMPLTRREREIVSHLAEGLTSKEIALRLDLSHRTVEVYRAKLLKKFGVNNTSGLFQSLGGIGKDHVVNRDSKA
ncbi:LuxR C-terminal-related transcriptional regulator [Pseudoprimorskyibacter insulae]|uniref:Transcriptional regulatory protein UhpA n=1 Tax=Pseudoprimorskyibacter insulae TaxID=1695997 RepID=A0A2R8AVD1_9RHOB|nr:LuxR C-terminal-related transcriptional regulator [Pseudoprimorskyibacter insulae]SPF79864.1 Transcriptional regulatory protein UhpA [Pseudoprimorskyibacter insulae]